MFAGINYCNSLLCGAQLQGDRGCNFVVSLPDGRSGKACLCFDFPLLLQLTSSVSHHCKNLLALSHWGASSQGRWCLYWHLLGWLMALMPSLCQSESWPSLFLFLVLCWDTSALQDLQKAHAAHFVAGLLRCGLECWRDDFLKWLLWNSEFISAILCVPFITKTQIRSAVTFVWYAGGNWLKNLIPEFVYRHLTLCLKSISCS